MSIEHWDTDLPERVKEAAAFILDLLRHEPAGTALADDASLWLREFDAWQASRSHEERDA